MGRGLVEVQGRLTVRQRGIWRLLALPGVVWLTLFFVLAFYATIAVAFGNQNTLSEPIPYWNPLHWNVGYMLQTLENIFTGGPFLTVIVRTFVFVTIALSLSLLIGYPVAYFAARHAGRWKALVLVLLILPFWINYLMRMLAWINLLAPDGIGTRVLHATGIEQLFMALGLLSTEGGWLEGQPATVILALVYGYVPFLILPLFAYLDRIDQRQIEAARDLGASPFEAFRRVTLPLSMPGVLAGLVLIALPMFGDYYTPDLVSGSPQTSLVGNQIDQFTRQGSQKVVGACLTLVLALMLLVLMVYYLRSTRAADKETQAA
jgi:ABC-type spermidine/putrescine transport system permease subunit I